MIIDIVQVYGGDGIEVVEMQEIDNVKNIAHLYEDDLGVGKHMLVLTFHQHTQAINLYRFLKEKADCGAEFSKMHYREEGATDTNLGYGWLRCRVNELQLVEGHPVVVIHLTDLVRAGAYTPPSDV